MTILLKNMVKIITCLKNNFSGLHSALLFAVLLISCSEQKTDRPGSAPNVIFILADDLGWSQSGAYGSTWYETPNIDRLAMEGLSFTNAYSAAAVCSPTRASIMTGKYPARLHLTDFIKGNTREDYPLKEPAWQKFLPLEEVTIAELFRDHDYATACFGKWHLSADKKPPESLPYNPDKQGFDEYFVTYKPDQNSDPQIDAHNTDTIVSLSTDFIKRMKEKPFFLYVSFNAIHDPLMEKKEAISEFEMKPGVELSPNNPVIGAMLKRMDDGIGRILKALEEQEIEDQSLVIFFSDNGGKDAYASQLPYRKGKGWLYEGGIRVPLIFRWPGKIEKATLSDESVISNDFFPTFACLLGDTSVNLTDGQNLLPHILEGKDLPGRDLFWHYPHYHFGSGMKPASAIRSGSYKLVYWYEKSFFLEEGPYELYDILTDPGETTNLAHEYPLITDSLKNKLFNFLSSTSAGIPQLNN